MFKRPLNIWPRRLVTGTLLAISMMASAGITLTTNADSRLGEVIGSLKQQSGYEFFYDDALAAQHVKAVALKDADLKAALDKIFDGTGISYSIKDKVIYLKYEIKSIVR